VTFGCAKCLLITNLSLHQVADCVCLMSLDKLEAVPIDTHVRQIAERDYNYKMTTKTLSPKSYQQLGK